MIPDGVSPILNHLWQSTAFAAVTGALALVLRKAQARLRYALWLAASMKFLVPFALFMAVGSRIHWPSTRAVVLAQWPAAVAQASEPFAESVAMTAGPIAGSHAAGSFWIAALVVLWAVGSAVVIGLWLARWRKIRALVRASRPIGVRGSIRVLSSPTLLEPSVFGIFKPVLLLPEGIETRLSTAQLVAVYAHELCHVRRRDNLAAALHMLVEALFWFHPLVWWLESRLIEERERACDEAVLQAGNRPQDYAESILEVCKLCVASPLACASGVSGADLKKRIETIMSCRVGRRLNKVTKALLASAAALAVLLPMAIGLLNTARAQEQPAQAFEVASIKPSDPAQRRIMLHFWPNFTAEGITARALIDESYQVHDFQIEGLPKWAESDRYDISTKADDSGGAMHTALAKMSIEQADGMAALTRTRIRALLADRFQLKVHSMTKEMPVYELVVAKGGPKLQASKSDIGTNRRFMMRPGGLIGSGADMKFLARSLSQVTSRVVVDKTGLHGRYDFSLNYTPERPLGPPAGGDGGPGPEMKPPDADANAPTLVTAVQEQLGLKLVPAKGPVEVLVVDRIEKPSPN
jgi:bla regulator protein blaR1